MSTRGLAREIEEMVEAIDGEVLVSRLWEERRLAFPIKGQRKGAYWLMYLRIPTLRLKGLARSCEIGHSVLRQLFVKLPPSLVDPTSPTPRARPSRSKSRRASRSTWVE